MAADGTPPEGQDPPGPRAAALALRGAKAGLSAPGFVMAASFIGYGAMTNDFGWPMWIAVASTALIWAAPAQFVLAGALASGAGIAAATLAVSVSSVRLLPMVVALLPVIRGVRTSLATRLFASHFVAVTAWFEGLRLTSRMPREERMPFFLGLGLLLLTLTLVATALGHALAGLLPTPLAVGLLAVTPIYFLMALERAAGGFAERLAIGIGLVIAPLISPVTPRFDLLFTGLAGGTIAFFAARARRRASGGAE